MTMGVTAPIEHINHNAIHLKKLHCITHSVRHLQLWFGVQPHLNTTHDSLGGIPLIFLLHGIVGGWVFPLHTHVHEHDTLTTLRLRRVHRGGGVVLCVFHVYLSLAQHHGIT